MTFATYFNPGVSLQGGSGSGTASLPISGNGATITASTPLVSGTQTWSNVATTFTAVKMDVTDTASASASLLMDLQVGSSSKFSVGKTGNVKASNGTAAIPAYGMGTIGIYTRASVRLNFAIGGSDAGIELGPSLLALQNTGEINWTSGALPSSGPDLYLTRRGTANLRLGAADAATPVAQTLSVQSRTGTDAAATAYPFTITGSQGTGTGAGGSIIFQVAPAGGTSNAVQNTLATAMVIDSVKTVRLGTGYTVATLPAAGTAGRRTYVTDATAPTFLGALIGGGAVVCPVFDNGTAWVSA